MKLQATKKEITEKHVHVIRVGYCDLYALLQQEQPQAYTAGIYGWNSDIYSYGSAAISTGYRAFGDIQPPYDLIKEYEEKAKKINLSTYDWAERKKLKKALIDKFILASI